MDADFFHKGDLVETVWGERALIRSEPKLSHINVAIWFHHRKAHEPKLGFSNPARLRLIRRAPNPRVQLTA